jgi:rhodanese-related sulfurtransferase
MLMTHRILATIAASLGLAAAAADGRPAADASQLAAEISAERDHITAPELAARIMRQDPSLRLFDLRPRAEYDQLHIPTATSVTLDELTRAPVPHDAEIVVYSEGGVHSAQAWVLLRLRGHRDVRFLREGIYEWLARVLEPRLASDATEAERADFARAEEQSRFFGGQPRSNVSRAEVPVGYWTETAGAASGEPTYVGRDSRSSPAAVIQATIGNVRRRGC